MDTRSSDGLRAGPFPAPRTTSVPRTPDDREPITLEVRQPAAMRAVVDAWRRLAERALEPNVFAEPGYLLPALQHLTAGRDVAILCAWQGPPQDGRLRGLVPIVTPRLAALAGRAVRLWRPPLSCGPAALVDETCPEAVLEAVLAELADRGAAGLLFPQLPLQGPTAAALRAVAGRAQRALGVLTPNKAANPPPGGPGAGFDPEDQHRRLSAMGEVRIERAQEPRSVRDAVEEFLALEASGSGRAALIQDVGAATFVRTMTRDLARSRRCRVDVMRAGGRPVAAAITLKGARVVWLWRAVRDERLAPGLAPDALLALELARTWRKQPRLEFGDACGLGGHPALRPFWGEPTARGDLLIGLQPETPAAAGPPWAPQAMARTLRTIAQSAYANLTGRRVLSS
jgi:CelD/BcsL family acetyltransferase involved in cellulose biosynthesis